MEIPVRVARVSDPQTLWHRDRETRALYALARVSALSLSFPTRPPAALACLVFRNFYTAALRLVQHNSDGSVFVLLSEFTLMQHAHCEDDAQNWHVLHLDQLCRKTDLSRIESLSLYLVQPSTVFDKWELQHLKLYESGVAHSPVAVTANPTATRGAPSSLRPRCSDLSSKAADNAGADAVLAGMMAKNTTGALHSLPKRPSRSSLLVVDARDVRDNSTQSLSLIHRLRELIHGPSALHS